MSLSNYAVCYEPIQRVYRNAVLSAVRRALVDQFPTDYGERVKRVYSKEWPELEEAARERRITGQLGTTLVDELDYLGVNHFSNLFEAFFDLIIPPQPGTGKRARQQERQAVITWAREIRALRDPMSHPSEDDLPYADAFRVLDSAQRILTKIDPSSVDKVRECLVKLNGAPAPLELKLALEGYLPPEESIAVQFVGRGKELDQLRTWLANPRMKRWALMGDGGKGKSAVAYRFACEVKGIRSRTSRIRNMA